MHTIRAFPLVALAALIFPPTASAIDLEPLLTAVANDVDDCTSELECTPDQTIVCLGSRACRPDPQSALCPDLDYNPFLHDPTNVDLLLNIVDVNWECELP